jgi:hypothetical protein
LRSILALVFASVVLGASAGPVLGVNLQRAEDPLVGILQDVGAILSSFSGGPDDPKSPVTSSATLAQDSARLDAATRKANELATELHNIQEATAERDRH